MQTCKHERLLTIICLQPYKNANVAKAESEFDTLENTTLVLYILLVNCLSIS